MAEREAKKQAKQAKKQKSTTPATTIITEVEQTTITKKLTTTTTTTTKDKVELLPSLASNTPQKIVASSDTAVTACKLGDSIPAATPPGEKSRDQIKAEREAKKAAKHAAKTGKSSASDVNIATQKLSNLEIAPKAAASQAVLGTEEEKVRV